MSKGRPETTKSFWCRLLLLLPICYFFCTTFSILFFCAVCVSQMILIVYFVDKKFCRRHVCSKAAAIAFSFWILFAQPAVRCNSNLSLNTQYRLHFPSQIHTTTTYQRFCNYTQQAVHFSILELLVKCKIAVETDAQRRSDNDKRLWYYKLC